MLKRRRNWGQTARDIGRISVRALWLGVDGFYHSDNLMYSAAIAYYALLSLFPFSMIAFSILGSVTVSENDRSEILDFVLAYFPRQFDFIIVQLDAFRLHTVTVGVLGTIAVFWGAAGIFGAITTAVNYAWGVEKNRSYWRHKLFQFSMLGVAALLLLLALLLVSAAQVVGAQWFAHVLGTYPALALLRAWTTRSATTMLFILVVGFVFYFAPNTKVRFRDVWIGAVLTGLLWKGMGSLFSWYMRDMTRFTRINGSIAAVVVFLIWVYLQAVILLYGVEFTAAYARMRRKLKDDLPI